MSLKRIAAIVLKELRDLRSNLNVLLIFVIPILLTLLYQYVLPDMVTELAISFGLLFLVTMSGMYVPSMTIAEEKEKRTLEVLLLSPASPLEVFVAKGFTTFSLIMIVQFGFLFLAQLSWKPSAVIFVATALTAIFCILVGMIIGLVVKNQMGTGIVGTPIYMLFMLVPLLSEINDGFISQLAKLLPTHYYFKILQYLLGYGQNIKSILPNLIVILVSILVALFALLLVYRYKSLNQD